MHLPALPSTPGLRQPGCTPSAAGRRLQCAATAPRRSFLRSSDRPPGTPPGRRPVSTHDSSGARASGDSGPDTDLDEFRTEAQVEQDPERWYDPVPAASLGDSGGSAVPIEADPVNVEEGVPPATAPVGQDAVNPWGMSAGQHTQPWRFQADQPQSSTAERQPASEPTPQASSTSGRTEPPPAPGRGPVRLSDGADARFKDTAVWRALCAVWWFVQKVNTTVIALLWIAFLLFAAVYVGAYVVKYIQLVVLRSAAGSAGIIASGGLA